MRHEFREWAKIRILPNGDTIRAAAYGNALGAVATHYQAEGRNATFVRVSSSIASLGSEHL